MNLWTFGRVDGLAESNRQALVIYYSGDAASTQIYWARVELLAARG